MLLHPTINFHMQQIRLNQCGFLQTLDDFVCKQCEQMNGKQRRCGYDCETLEVHHTQLEWHSSCQPLHFPSVTGAHTRLTTYIPQPPNVSKSSHSSRWAAKELESRYSLCALATVEAHCPTTECGAADPGLSGSQAAGECSVGEGAVILSRIIVR